MIRYYHPSEVNQGSEEWHRLRDGLITGTNAYDVLMGQTYEQIIYNKIHNHFSGDYYTKRGHILEDEARDIYSKVYSPIIQVGFIKNDKYPICGYSPDGLILDTSVSYDTYAALWECKAFNEERHLEVYDSLDSHVLAQIQFGLLLTELPWCDLTLYNPDIEDIDNAFLVKRVYPDLAIQEALKDKIKIMEKLLQK